MSKIIIVGGPTGSGKSEIAIDLAINLGGEIVSADSVQVFKEFNIGSAKILKNEMRGITHYMLDIVEPNDRFTVADFSALARKKIDEILQRGRQPIVCGGTGLYINSLIYDMDWYDSDFDEALRLKLGKMDSSELIDYARKVGVDLSDVQTCNDRRIIRAIEIYELTGRQPSSFKKVNRSKYEIELIIPDIKRDQLYDRINKRTIRMIDQGLVNETEQILKKYGDTPQALTSIGYRQAAWYISKGDPNLKDELISKIQQSTRNYAKRQITWFNRYRKINK